MPDPSPASVPKAKKTFGYQPSLDGIRAIAVLLVMANHTSFFHAGRLGVDIFFVLSGYLITAILVSEFSVTDTISLKKFYARRALRILPAAILLLVVVNLASHRFQTRSEAATVGWNSLAALFYIANWMRAFGRDMGILGHLWSLSIEEQFYLLWPVALLFLLARKLTIKQIILVAAVAILLVNADRLYLYNGAASWHRIYNGLDTRADALLVGCVLGLSGYEMFSARVFAVLGLIGAFFILSVLTLEPFTSEDFQIRFWLTVGETVFAVAVMAVLAGVLSNPYSISAKALKLPLLVWIGRLSYGLYLWHYFVFAFVGGWFHKLGPLQVFPLQLLATFLMAALSYYLLEKPCLNLKKRFSVIKTPVPITPNPLESVDH